MAANNIDERFLFTSRAMPDAEFHVARFTGTEGLSTLFTFKILLVCPDPSLDTTALLDDEASFTIRRDDGNDAVFTGYLASAEQGGRFNGYSYYTVELRPAFWLLTQVVQSAIFLNKDVAEVADGMLNSLRFIAIPHCFHLQMSEYPKPEFAMQYNESLYDYLCWRMEEQGVYFYFATVQAGPDTLVFADGFWSHDKPALTVNYSPASGLEGDRLDEVVVDFTLVQQRLPSNVVVRSYSWLNPNRPIIGTAPVSKRGLGDAYLSNEAVESEEAANRIARIRAEELLARQRVFTGRGSVPVLRPGVVFMLDRHYNPAFNRDYMVTDITHEGSQETLLGLKLDIPMHKAPDHLFYHNTFHCIEADRNYRPARKAPRATIPGVVHAFVDGNGANDSRPFLDEYGRYRLIFPFDVSGRSDGNGSCWIRRAQEQVGQNSGMSFQLLPGTEVLVSFTDGNPDRPVITGALPNGETGALTGRGNTEISGIRTEGGNALIFNNKDTKQGFMLGNAAGNGLSISSGSLDFGLLKSDTWMEATALGGASVAGLFKNTLNGYSNLSKVSTMNKDKVAWTAAKTIPPILTNIFTALSNHASSDTAKENWAWGSDAAKMLLLLIANAHTYVQASDPGKHPFGMELTSDKGKVMSLMQCDPSVAELVTEAVLLLAGRVASATAEGLVMKESVDEKKLENTWLAAKAPGYKLNELTENQKSDLEDYKKLQKKNILRKCIVSQISDLIPEVAAFITTLVWSNKVGKKILGGVKIQAGSQNIHLQAKTYLGQHAEKGILLNTINKEASKSWGAPTLIDNYQSKLIEKSNEALDDQILNDESFIVMNTKVNHQWSRHHIVQSKVSSDIISPSIILRDKQKVKESDFCLSFFDGKAGLNAKYIMLQAKGDVKTNAHFEQGNIKIQTGTSICDINKDAISLTSNKKGRVIVQGSTAFITNSNSFIMINDDKMHLASKKLCINDVVLQDGKIKGNKNGLLEIGKAIKITGCAEALSLEGALKATLNKVSKAEEEQKDKTSEMRSMRKYLNSIDSQDFYD